MLFNSLEFMLFLPVVFILYWFVFLSRNWQNLLIVNASYVFYGWWDWRFLALITLTTTCSFASGLLMDKLSVWKRAICTGNVILNLAVLGLFKYFNFFVENMTELAAQFGLTLDWGTINVILPVGISFYTFQTLSYTIDVSRGHIKPTRDMIAFFAYISFFPQLVAGPIERATNTLSQFQHNRHFQYEHAADGIRQMLWGFFKKMVVADNCAIAVNYIWANYNNMSSITLIIGAMLFSFQIYGDFSGYSDIAIGCGRLFGIQLTRNFHFPYFAQNIQDFWRRWHISLMRWFTDYVYIPLGGNRCSKIIQTRNIIIVFVLSGLWHGANWTFVAWGLYHAVLLCAYLSYRDKIITHFNKPLFKAVGIITTFTLVTIGWIIFRAPTKYDAIHYIEHIFAFSGSAMSDLSVFNLPLVLTAIIIMLTMEWLNRKREHALHFNCNSAFANNSVMRYSLYVVLMMGVCIFSGTQSQFIYFQF